MASAAPGRVLVWGAGAIGGIAAAYLARACHDVTAVDLDAAHVAVMRDPDRGLAVTGPIDEFRVPLPAFVPERLSGTWERVLLAVKGQHTQAACQALLPHLDADGYVVSLQNGLCEPSIAAVVGRHRTIGCFVNYAGDRLEPGLVRYGQRGELAVGELDGRMSDRLNALVGLLRSVEPGAFATEDVDAYLWGKLGFAAILYGTALARSPMVPLIERPDLLALWRALAGEVMAVARAEGVTPRGGLGFEPAAFMPGASAADARASLDAVLSHMRGGAKPHSGIWRDIAVHRRPTEIGVQITPVIEAGGRHGLACPTLRGLVSMIRALESGSIVQADDALLRLRRDVPTHGDD